MKNLFTTGLITFSLFVLLILSACSKTENKAENEKKNEAAKPEVPLPADLFTDKAPEGALEIAKAKETAEEGKTIVVRGKIGGSTEPFIEGRALMTVNDMAVQACNENPDDPCDTPWDMCCDKDRHIKIVTIQVNGADGKPLNATLEGKGGLHPLSVVVVQGKVAPRPNKDTFIINAEKIFVEKEGIKR